jgi:hypothetical protein
MFLETLALPAPQATIYSVDKWDSDYLCEKDGEAALFGVMGATARQGSLDDAIQHTKQLLDQLPLYETFVRHACTCTSTSAPPILRPAAPLRRHVHTEAD